jgi:hypothetical protein
VLSVCALYVNDSVWADTQAQKERICWLGHYQGGRAAGLAGVQAGSGGMLSSTANTIVVPDRHFAFATFSQQGLPYEGLPHALMLPADSRGVSTCF